MVCKQLAKGFILNCTLPHFYLRDYIAQTITTNYILQNFVGGITPFLSTSVYFRRASLTDHHLGACIGWYNRLHKIESPLYHERSYLKLTEIQR